LIEASTCHTSTDDSNSMNSYIAVRGGAMVLEVIAFRTARVLEE
jgi:hypothetical protein